MAACQVWTPDVVHVCFAVVVFLFFHLFIWFVFYFNSKGLERTWWLSTWTLHFFYVHEIIVCIEVVDVLLCRHVGFREGRK